MIRAFINIGQAFGRLGVALGKAFAQFGREVACAFSGCKNDGSGCCR